MHIFKKLIQYRLTDLMSEAVMGRHYVRAMLVWAAAAAVALAMGLEHTAS